MARPVKWSRDVHAIRERAERSRTEIWSRHDIEHLFGISRPSAQNLMKGIGGVQIVGGTHFVDRASLLAFLSEIIAAPSVEEGVRLRHEQAAPTPQPAPLHASLPAELRSTMISDLPDSICVEPGLLTIRANTAEAMLEALVLLAQAMTNDLERFRSTVEPVGHSVKDQELHAAFARWRATQTAEIEASAIEVSMSV